VTLYEDLCISFNIAQLNDDVSIRNFYDNYDVSGIYNHSFLRAERL
jgi:hypothetical protein